jgi:hypothetical protein
MTRRTLLAHLSRLVLLVGIWGGVGPVAAQEPEILARARYSRAQQEFQELQRLALDLGPRVAQVARTVQSHRESGNQRSAEDVFVNEYYALAMQLQNVGIRSDAAKAALDEARRELLRILRDREERFLRELESRPPRAREDEINRQIVRIRQDVTQLERERELIAEVGFRPVPRVEAAPTDGPAELRAKAGFLERTSESNAAVIAFIDEEIRVRERALRLQRGFQDTRDGIGRFDGDRPPGTGPGTRTPTPGDRGIAGIEAVPPFSELPLAEQIERLRSVRIQAEEARVEALARAGELRRLAILRGGEE